MAKKKENPIASFGGASIDLAKFNLKNDKEQYEEIEKQLKEIYGDNLDVSKKDVMKVLRLTYNPKDDYIYLSNGLKISKEKLGLKFNVVKRKIGIGWIVFGTIILIFSLMAATYSGIKYLSLVSLNKDIDLPFI